MSGKDKSLSGQIRSYEGKDITVHFSIQRCTHVAVCLRGLPLVFNTVKRPWVSPDLAEARDIARVVLECPTGSLHYDWKEGGPEPVSDNEITIVRNGPLYVRGEVEIVNEEGSLLMADTRLALCRCGKSRNPPLCDGHHYHAGFRDAGRLFGRKEEARESHRGKLRITVQAKGPLKVSGMFQWEDSRGLRVTAGPMTILCSCGRTGRSPFCDGSHTKKSWFSRLKS